MEFATFLQTKDRALCNFSYRHFVSWRHWNTSAATAHENVSACAASIVRLRYSIKVIRYEDVSYLGGILDLWAIAEATSGILAMCLPISPKFFRSLQDAKLWSSLKISLHSFVRKSTSGPLSNSETPSEQNIAAKLDSRSISLKNPPFKKYHYITTNELELASVSSSKDSCADGGRNVRAVDDHAGMEIAWSLFRSFLFWGHYGMFLIFGDDMNDDIDRSMPTCVPKSDFWKKSKCWFHM